MVNVVKPAKTIVKSKDGECEISISIELNINLNNNSQPIVETNITAQKVTEKKEEEQENYYAIPDFSNLKKVQFGKEI